MDRQPLHHDKPFAKRATIGLDALLAEHEAKVTGLGGAEAAARLEELGPNEAAPASRPMLIEMTRAAANPLVLVLLFAAGASAFLGEPVNAAIIAAIVLLSAAVNVAQTVRSERAVRKLQSKVAPTATALRDGAWIEVPRREIVTGDVVRLSAGDLVPADARLIEAHDLHVQQSALTGEPFPVAKDAAHGELSSHGPDEPALVFLGTSVVSGSGTAVVFATGARTSFGDVIERLSAKPDETEFERGAREFGMLILRTVIFLVLFILVASISMHRDALQSLLFAVALAVGLTPEFLPVITTVTLAQGAVAMAKDKVIVKHLSSIQNLGGIDVLCSDKTGTLTAGTMSVAASLDPFGGEAEAALHLALLNSRFETGIRSPLDRAILERGGPSTEGWTKTDEIPFDFERRRLSVIVARDGAHRLVTKGAPEGVLDECTHVEVGGERSVLDDERAARCRAAVSALGSKGLRVLAVAYKDVPRADGFSTGDERDLTLVGYVTFEDHLLDGVPESLARLRADGVAVKILTGDSETVTRALCEQVGIDASTLVLGSDLERLDDRALARVAERSSVLARVTPAQKHRIVRALKAHGHVVGFLGDGINDAPSLHAADVGISVAGAVDVAKEASDIILLEHRLDVLHSGILAGRRSFGNVFKYLLMGTSSNFGNMFSMAGAALFLPFLPMLPQQILLNNFLYDLAQIAIPTDRVDDVYVRRPQRWDVRVIRDFMLLIGPVSSLYDFVTFFLLLKVLGFGEAAFHTGWFVESLATQTLVLFVIRTVGRPWVSRPSSALAWTMIAIVTAGLVLPFTPLAPLLGFVPLPLRYYAMLALLVGSYLVLVEIVKRRVLRRLLG